MRGGCTQASQAMQSSFEAERPNKLGPWKLGRPTTNYSLWINAKGVDLDSWGSDLWICAHGPVCRAAGAISGSNSTARMRAGAAMRPTTWVSCLVHAQCPSACTWRQRILVHVPIYQHRSAICQIGGTPARILAVHWRKRARLAVPPRTWMRAPNIVKPAQNCRELCVPGQKECNESAGIGCVVWSVFEQEFQGRLCA